ncbi:hypothetical protein NQ317_006663 [Molorchus minor]|uniref:Uncharacterized protein n=1 Tax=Molorchus minor TaxID=1323400 RepID=A0ABQ9JW93_9CUCU|nr:hypothetical protein NQ317_006663 [Molorchus minor]
MILKIRQSAGLLQMWQTIGMDRVFRTVFCQEVVYCQISSNIDNGDIGGQPREGKITLKTKKSKSKVNDI